MTIRILGMAFNLQGEIDNLTSLIITRRHYSIGQFELHLNLEDGNKYDLQDKILWFGSKRYKAGFVKSLKVNKQDGNLTIKGLLLKGIMQKRITVPGADGYDRVKGNAETVIKHYSNNHLVNPTDSKRKLSGVSIATDQQRGIITPWQSRYEKLDEVIEEICKFCDIGYSVELDLQNKGFIIDVVEGLDRTTEQNTRPPVIFSSELDSMDDLEYTYSNQEHKSVGYAGGKGEDENRLVLSVGNATDWERNEVFLDCTSAESADELTSLGEQSLSEYKEIRSLEGSLTQSNSFIYETDWFLGDRVTVQDRELGLILHTRVTEVRESYEGGSLEIEATFGDTIPTLKQYLKKKENVR